MRELFREQNHSAGAASFFFCGSHSHEKLGSARPNNGSRSIRFATGGCITRGAAVFSRPEPRRNGEFFCLREQWAIMIMGMNE